MSELVREIVEVNAGIEGDEENPLLVVDVEGLAPTGGWTSVRLEPHTYIDAPDDGFQDFDLVGDRPPQMSSEGAATDALTEVEAGYEGPLEDWCIGVRVHAVDNMFEEEVFGPWDSDDEESEAA
ncbi:hypothetical protein L7H23_04650 [Sphingopyxis sp. BSN-002]|uniref:hypothetical protein n=1 Tax=Sphingopyxis sp. BSN-002 TaxID=2911495 RepID=UPI001EDB20ED|nr:hypothetical protein [Sphingopyxis sp. BSN-002]UKK85405.1 hypothetical protein L7H23_04650 [Sphingopyxis sp. BSN-002]